MAERPRRARRHQPGQTDHQGEGSGGGQLADGAQHRVDRQRPEVAVCHQGVGERAALPVDVEHARADRAERGPGRHPLDDPGAG